MNAIKKNVLQNLPDDIYIGACNTNNKIALPRSELKFDFDINLYDEIRICCQSQNICNKCFQLLLAAHEILNNMLKTHYNFKNILWVFSANRLLGV